MLAQLSTNVTLVLSTHNLVLALVIPHLCLLLML